LFYSTQIQALSKQKVEQNLDLAAAAGAISLLRTFALPAGAPEGNLPKGDFVLASPLAGWRSKQWPLEFFGTLAVRLRAELGVPLALNGTPEYMDLLAPVPLALPLSSGMDGLMDATRLAPSAVRVYSGPLPVADGLGT